MENTISQGTGILRLILGVMFIVLSIFMWGDVQREDVVKDATIKFTDRVRFEAYMTRDMYEEYMNTLSQAPYKVTFYHIKYSLDAKGNRVMTVYTEKNIFSGIYNTNPSQRIYKFDKGDDFFVSVAPMAPSPFNILLGSLTRGNVLRGKTIAKGGMIFNNPPG